MQFRASPSLQNGCPEDPQAFSRNDKPHPSAAPRRLGRLRFQKTTNASVGLHLEHQMPLPDLRPRNSHIQEDRWMKFENNHDDANKQDRVGNGKLEEYSSVALITRRCGVLSCRPKTPSIYDTSLRQGLTGAVSKRSRRSESL